MTGWDSSVADRSSLHTASKRLLTRLFISVDGKAMDHLLDARTRFTK